MAARRGNLGKESIYSDMKYSQYSNLSLNSMNTSRPGWRVYEKSKPEYRSGYYGDGSRSITPEHHYREYDEEMRARLQGRDPRFMSRRDLEEYLRVREILKEKKRRERAEREQRNKPFVVSNFICSYPVEKC